MTDTTKRSKPRAIARPRFGSRLVLATASTRKYQPPRCISQEPLAISWRIRPWADLEGLAHRRELLRAPPSCSSRLATLSRIAPFSAVLAVQIFGLTQSRDPQRASFVAHRHSAYCVTHFSVSALLVLTQPLPWSQVKTWDKVTVGMIKMYKAEVLGKLSVAVQHFLFGQQSRQSEPRDLMLKRY